MRTLKTPGIILATLALTGCASTQDIARQAPDHSFLTAATTDQARDCILGTNPAQFNTAPHGKGWTLSMAGGVNGANGIMVVEITPEGQATRVETHMAKTLLTTAPYDDTVLPCIGKLPKV